MPSLHVVGGSRAGVAELAPNVADEGAAQPVRLKVEAEFVELCIDDGAWVDRYSSEEISCEAVTEVFREETQVTDALKPLLDGVGLVSQHSIGILLLAVRL